MKLGVGSKADNCRDMRGYQTTDVEEGRGKRKEKN
jgi:hypothetical protein